MLNRHGSIRKIVFGCLDLLAILAGIYMARSLRHVWKGVPISEDNMALKIIIMVFAFQIIFYYFDLYDFKKFQQKKGLGLPAAIGIASLLLGVLYYLVPWIAFDRSAFLTTVFAVGMTSLFWRMVYLCVIKTQLLRERILIIGTGEMAKKVQGEILENGHDDFEIVGFIDEGSDKIGNVV